MKKILITAIIISTSLISAQTKDAKKILDAVKQKFNVVNDYQVNAEVKLDMSFIKVPDTKAKVYFKKPNKIKVDAEGFAILPKQGLRFSPAELFKEDFTPLYVRSEITDGRKLDIIKIIPSSDSSEVILSTLWVDAAESVVRKIETSRRKSGTTVIELSYNDYQYGLPSQIRLTFNLGEMQMPANLNQNNQDNAADKKNKKGRDSRGSVDLKGSVIMTYSNYIVNKGIPDSFFVEKEKEKKKQLD